MRRLEYHPLLYGIHACWRQITPLRIEIMNILVTGGAGYIGSHTVKQWLDASHRVVVLDNFYSGHRWAVDDNALLVEGNIADQALLDEVLTQNRIEAVVHLNGNKNGRHNKRPSANSSVPVTA